MDGVVDLLGAQRGSHGRCRLCGNIGPLTWTHVPPRCADNSGTFWPGLRAVQVGDAVWFPVKGRFQEGGAKQRWTCETCNLAVSRYDPEWGRIAKALLAAEVAADRAPAPRQPVTLRIEGFRPGSLVRSMLAGMFAAHPSAQTWLPDLAKAIVSGESFEPPSSLHLLLGCYFGGHRYVRGGMTLRRDPWREGLIRIDGEICWPPFHLVLVHSDDLQEWTDPFTIMPWMNGGYTEEFNHTLTLQTRGDTELFFPPESGQVIAVLDRPIASPPTYKIVIPDR